MDKLLGEMMMNKELIERKDDIFSKIGRFLRKIFFKEEKNDTKQLKNIHQNQEKNRYSDNKKEAFNESLRIVEDKEEMRLLKLQRDIKNQVILVDDISDDDFFKLVDLYDNQINNINLEIEKLNKSVEMYKEKAIELIKECKNT